MLILIIVIIKPLDLGSGVAYQPPDTNGFPWGGGIVFSKDLGQLESRSVNVHNWMFFNTNSTFKECILSLATKLALN